MKRRNFLVTAFAGLAAAIIPVFRKKPLTKELGTYVPTGPGIPVPYDKSSHLIVTTGYKKEGDGGGGIFSWSPNSFKNDRVIISGIDEGYNTVEIQVEAMPMYGNEWVDITHDAQAYPYKTKKCGVICLANTPDENKN